MKKVFRFLPVAAIVLGSGLALATITETEGPNVYRDPNDGEWKPLLPDYPPGSYTCPLSGDCTAHMDKDGNISKVTDGRFTPNEK